MNRPPALLLVATLLIAAACRSTPGGAPYEPMTDAARRPGLAERLNDEAARLLDADSTRAERLLREAITADLYCGPAHNNLGVLLLRRDLLFEAASEFQFAARLMPGHPDPRFNLGLTLERAGRTLDAEDAFRAALDVRPGHLASIQASARSRVRRGLADEETRALLEDIALRGETDQWRSWARLEALRRGAAPSRSDPSTPPPISGG